MSDERPNDYTPPTYTVCPSCQCGFDEKPGDNICPACKKPFPVEGKGKK